MQYKIANNKSLLLYCFILHKDANGFTILKEKNSAKKLSLCNLRLPIILYECKNMIFCYKTLPLVN